MSKFDESKVINSLHTERAEIGKKYYCSDNIIILKRYVENDDIDSVYELTALSKTIGYAFSVGDLNWALLYPYEELPKKRMTNYQLSEWLAKNNGQCQVGYSEGAIYTQHTYNINFEDDIVDNDIFIRPWGSDEWVEPTVDIYERDCKHISQDEIDDVAYRDGCY